jgi:hypothetical protein
MSPFLAMTECATSNSVNDVCRHCLADASGYDDRLLDACDRNPPSLGRHGILNNRAKQPAPSAGSYSPDKFPAIQAPVKYVIHTVTALLLAPLAPLAPLQAADAPQKSLPPPGEVCSIKGRTASVGGHLSDAVALDVSGRSTAAVPSEKTPVPWYVPTLGAHAAMADILPHHRSVVVSGVNATCRDSLEGAAAVCILGALDTDGAQGLEYGRRFQAEHQLSGGEA